MNHSINNGATGTPQSFKIGRAGQQVTTVKSLSKTKHRMRITAQLENIEGEFARVLGNARFNERAQEQRSDYKAYRQQFKLK